MKEFLSESIIFGAVLSLAAYEIGLLMKKKFKLAILNPLLIGTICVIGFLLIFRIDYEEYNEGAKYISYLLTPATVCLAVPLYEQLSLLKKNLWQWQWGFYPVFWQVLSVFWRWQAV